MACTCRQLSEKRTILTVFVKAFAILNAFYHVHGKKSNVFAARTKNILLGEKNVDKLIPLCLNVSNICKDFDGKFVLSEILPESRWLVKTGENGKCDLVPESEV